MNTKEMIEVMQAFDDGKDIQFRNKGSEFEWHLATAPIWDWDAIIYCVKVELSLEDRIKAEFPDKRVVMLEWGREGNDSIDLLKMMEVQFMYPCESGGYHSTHTEAQSMRNFYKYVYEVEDGSFVLSRSATMGEGNINSNETVTPVAVLFSVQS